MSDTPTVYIVTAGDYSDYHITAVFQTEAEAGEYVEWRWGHQDSPDARIEEWSVGWPAKHRSRTGMWWAYGSRDEESPRLLFDPDGGDREESTTIEPNGPYWEIKIYRHDRERAIRAYQQARRDLLAGPSSTKYLSISCAPILVAEEVAPFKFPEPEDDK